MTGKEYAKIAERINAHVNLAREVPDIITAQAKLIGFRELVSSFCVIFAEGNQSFKAEKFVKECGF